MIRIFTETFANLIHTSAGILNAEKTAGRSYSSLSEEPGMGGGGYFAAGGVVERSNDAIATTALGSTMDPGQDSAMLKPAYFVDIIVPTVLIALLLLGNAVIVFVIFQYRKRKQPELHGEDIVLQDPSVPQV